MSLPERRFEPIDLLDAALCGVVFVGVFALLMATMDIGIPRDESFYFHAGRLYLGWFEEMAANWQAGDLFASFQQASIDKHMSYNREHPALMKMLFGLGLKLFHEKLAWLNPIEAMRVPTVLFSSAGAVFTYLLGRQIYGRAAGFIAVVLLFAQPRFFFHAHLACFDAPVVACWMATAYGYFRSYDSHRWAMFTGIAWGLALSVKLNAFFLPVVLGLHWMWVVGRGYFGTPEEERRLPQFPWVFFWMVVFGVVLFFGLWPRHWYDTVDRVEWYLNFHLKHVHYFVYYFGENIQQPPLPVSFPWMMSLVTIPATILAAFVAGVVLHWRQPGPAGEVDPRHTTLFLALNIVFFYVLISNPTTPIFGGTKHWSTAMPFLSIVAAGGIVFSGRALGLSLLNRLPGSSFALRAAAIAALSAAVAVPAIMAVAENHPNGTAYYNELIGSYRGAADARMQRQFWGYAAYDSFDWLNAEAPQGARVWTHNTTGYAWREYRASDMVRADLRPSGARGSQIGLYHHQKAFIYMLIPLWDTYGTRAPVHVDGIDGVPVLSVYAREPEKLGR